MRATRYADYRQAMLAGLAAYQQRRFAGRDVLFEPSPATRLTFSPGAAHRNLFDPALYHDLAHRPPSLRQMTSARALAISVFGTLARREDLGLLSEALCTDGQPIIPAGEARQALSLTLQGVTGVDLWLSGPRLRLAVAPYFLERSLDSCKTDRRGHCPGMAECDDLAWLNHRVAECPLRRLSGLIHPLRALAADPMADAVISRRLLLVCDARNPAFAPAGRLSRLLAELQQALPPPFALQRTTWQAINAPMARSPWYSDLLAFLKDKYGIDS